MAVTRVRLFYLHNSLQSKAEFRKFFRTAPMVRGSWPFSQNHINETQIKLSSFEELTAMMDNPSHNRPPAIFAILGHS